MKTTETLPKPNAIVEKLLKMEKPESGPFEVVCMYSKTEDGETLYAVVGHANFDMVLYEGPSKERANDVYYRLTSVYATVDSISDDEL